MSKIDSIRIVVPVTPIPKTRDYTSNKEQERQEDNKENFAKVLKKTQKKNTTI